MLQNYLLFEGATVKANNSCAWNNRNYVLKCIYEYIWIHLMSEESSERNVSCHFSTAKVKYSWLFNNRNYTLPWRYSEFIQCLRTSVNETCPANSQQLRWNMDGFSTIKNPTEPWRCSEVIWWLRRSVKETCSPTNSSRLSKNSRWFHRDSNTESPN